MPGPRPNTTPAQRERVLALVDAGRSYSAVAAEVFGEARFRGRVERIVRRERDCRPAGPALDDLLAVLAREDQGHQEIGKYVKAGQDLPRIQAELDQAEAEAQKLAATTGVQLACA